MVLPSLRLCLALSSLPAINPWSKILVNKTKNGRTFYKKKKTDMKGGNSHHKNKFIFKYCQTAYRTYKCPCNIFFKKQ